MAQDVHDRSAGGVGQDECQNIWADLDCGLGSDQTAGDQPCGKQLAPDALVPLPVMLDQ